MKLPRIVSSLPTAAAATSAGSGAVTGGSASQPIIKHKKPHLVLHFDINETILIGDEAGGDSREDCLNKMLAKSAFVLMNDGKEQHEGQGEPPDASRRALAHTKHLKPTQWWDGSPIIASAAETKDNEGSGEEGDVHDDNHVEPAPLYTGWQWPPNSCPYYRTSYKKRAKDFTLHDGAPYRSLYQELEKRVTFLPDDVMASDGHQYPHALHHMLPAFFHTLNELKRQGRSFGLVLRTFGSDLPDIAEALNVFAEGKHPLYPNFHDQTLILTPEKNMFRGRWRLREGSDGQDAATDFEYRFLKWSNEESGGGNGENESVEKIAASGDAELLEIIENCSVAGIQDDYSFWDRNSNAPWAGKPVWTHRRSSTDVDGRRCHHIFFDDNIHNDATDSIAAVRLEDEGRFKSLSGGEILDMQGKHLLRVPTVAPILDNDWFLDRIKDAEESL